MNRRLNVSILEVVGSPFCVASDDGQRVFERLQAALTQQASVTVSFRNVSNLTSAFLNSAIGQLYGIFSADEIRSRLRVTEIEPDDRALLKRVVQTARAYFQDPERFKRAAKDALA